MLDFKVAAEAIKDEMIARRRDLHRHPELAFEEVRTAGIVAEELHRLGIEVQTGIGRTGVVGILQGETEGPTVLVRADMDALPIQEENETDYVSQIPGKMHACGHDGHVTIALGVAKLLAAQRQQISGQVKFVFQPAEETAGGAQSMVADGVLDNPRPDVSVGLHVWNEMPLGRVVIADGPIMSGASIFRVKITGHGGHAAIPEATRDPVICAAHLITALQTIVGRNVDPLQSAVFSVTQMKGSDAHNIIPNTAELGGTFRVFTMEMRELVEHRFREIAEQLCAAMGCTVDIDVNHVTIPVVNHPEVAGRLRKRFARFVDNIETNYRTMASEDVAYLMDDIPGAFILVGSANAERGLNYPHHHARFDFDEDVLPLGAALLSSAVAEYLIK